MSNQMSAQQQDQHWNAGAKEIQQSNQGLWIKITDNVDYCAAERSKEMAAKSETRLGK